jgi:anaerobic glycerol-3-phosphate dehydrogenase
MSHASATPDPATAVCGFSGLPHFNAQTLARIWGLDAPLRAHTIELAATPAAGWSTPSLAAHLERSPDELIGHLRDLGIGRAIFPAVLGIERVHDVIARLAEGGVDALEALAATPSIPGWRLQQATGKLLAERGVSILNGRAAGHVSGRRVQHISLGDDVITASAFVLATGKYLAGGIVADEEFHEPAFGLPVWLLQLGDVFTAPDALTLTDPVRTESQPLLDAGVHTDEVQRPVDRARAVLYENLFVAGTVRAGWPVAATGLGNCADDGWSAGERASA